jgi:hypothetical protein
MMMETDTLAAISWLKEVGRTGNRLDSQYCELILAALPEEVTNPKPELPSRPGCYSDRAGLTWVHDQTGYWYKFGNLQNRIELDDVQTFAPFTRLVPEKPPVTPAELRDVVARVNKYGPDSFNALADYVNGARA